MSLPVSVKLSKRKDGEKVSNVASELVSESGTRQRWPVLISTFLSYFYDSFDLAILSIAMPVLIKVLNIDLAAGGLLASATMIGAAVGSMVLGVVAENRGRKFTLVFSLVWFGIGTGLIYFVSSYSEWLLLRFLTGIAIGGVWGPCVALVASHWAPRFRARASGFMLSTFAIASIAAALIGRFVLSVDWRLLFIAGATAVIAAVIVQLTVPDDSESVKANTKSAGKGVSLGTIFSGSIAKYTILGTLLNVANMGGYWGAATWIPTYLIKVRELSLTQMADFSMVMYTGMFCGYQGFAYLGDKVGRKKAMIASFCVDVVAIPLYLIIPDAQFLFWWGAVVGFGFGGVFGLMGAFYAELFPERVRALAGGFCFNVGRLGAVAAPYTVGLIGQAYGLNVGLMIVPVFFAAAIVVMLFLPETIKDSPIVEQRPQTA